MDETLTARVRANKARKEKRRERIFGPSKNCAICGNEYLPVRHAQLYCSPLCRHDAWIARQASKNDAK